VAEEDLVDDERTERLRYEEPRVDDLGSLAEVTQGASGVAGADIDLGSI
jgi:hypothetical protein